MICCLLEISPFSDPSWGLQGRNGTWAQTKQWGSGVLRRCPEKVSHPSFKVKTHKGIAIIGDGPGEPHLLERRC